MIRAKISIRPMTDGPVGSIIRIEWIEISEGEIPGDVVLTEEFNVPFGSESAYVSRLCVDHAHVQKGTFWLDKDGRRHFAVDCERGEIKTFGSGVDFVPALLGQDGSVTTSGE